MGSYYALLSNFFSLQSHHFHFIYIFNHRCWWSCNIASMSIAIFLLHSTGPPVNVTCNIFINSFGSVTETTMVSATVPLAREKRDSIMLWTQPVKFSIVQLTGPPVNVTCNIFINSFGSIAETTMVSGTEHWSHRVKDWDMGSQHCCIFMWHLLSANL